MPRKMRGQYPGAIYHVMSRGDRREDIFLDDVDRQDFLKTMAEACQKTGFQVHAYCLMRNHFHLVVETPDANLVAGMAWLLSAYTIRLNHRHQFCGHVFSGRYKALRRGWCFGSVEFKRQMLQRMDGQLGEHHAGDLRRENAGGRAERIIAEELQRLGWTESELLGQRKSAAGKLALAARLRRETTMPLKWIAARVRLGTTKSANSKLHHWMKENKKPGAHAVMTSVEPGRIKHETNQTMG